MKKYEPLDDICIRLTGKSLPSTTKNRWIRGKNVEGRKLHAIKINGCVHCIEEDVIAYLTVGGTADSEGPAAQPKFRSEKARQRASEDAHKELDAMLGARA